MTSYVLCGGAVTWAALNDCGPVGNGDLVLVAPWGTRDALGQAIAFRNHRDALEEVWPGAACELARPGRLREQLADARALVLPGGDSPTLINALRHERLAAPDLDGKAVLAVSAGVSALTKVSFNRDRLKIVRGLGLVDAASVVHYRPGATAPAEGLTWAEALEQLAQARRVVGARELYLLDDLDHVAVTS